MDPEFISIVQKIISDRGISIVNNRKVFKSLLEDYTGYDFANERKFFIKELETTPFDELMKKCQSPQPPPAPMPQTMPTPAPNSPIIDNSNDEDDIDDVNRLLKKGWKRLSSGNFEKAEKTFKKIIRIAPDCGFAYCGLGLIAENYGNHHAAIDLYKDAIGYFEAQGDTQEVKNCKRFIKELKEQIATDSRRSAENMENINKIITNVIDIFAK